MSVADASPRVANAPRQSLRGIALWLLLLAAAFANGAFREVVLVPTVGDQFAHAVSSIVLASVIVRIVGRSVSWSRIIADYEVLHSRRWILVPLATLIAPAAGFSGRSNS